MKESKQWDEAESIQLIRSMIETTRYRIYSDRILFFMWGYATMFCAAAHYILAYLVGYSHPYVVWLLMPVLAVFHFVYIAKKHKSSGVATFPGRVMEGIWGGMFIGIVGLLLGASHIGWEVIYPVFMLFYGVACYATGKALQFKFLAYGGLASIACGVFAFFQPFQFQLLLLMLAILVSYILPAHFMKPSNS